MTMLSLYQVTFYWATGLFSLKLRASLNDGISCVCNQSIGGCRVTTVEPRYNELLCNEVLGITNDFFNPTNGQIYEKKTSI